MKKYLLFAVLCFCFSPVKGMESKPLTLDLQLHIAAKEGDINRVIRLIKQGAEINRFHCDEYGSDDLLVGTPLTSAIEKNHFKVAFALLKAGASVDKIETSDPGPLASALCLNKDDDELLCFIKHLLKRGAKIEPSHIFDAVSYSDKNIQPDILNLLFDYGADPNAIVKPGIKLLDWAETALENWRGSTREKNLEKCITIIKNRGGFNSISASVIEKN